MLYKYFNYYYLFEVEMTGAFADNNDDDDVHLVRLQVLLFSCVPMQPCRPLLQTLLSGPLCVFMLKSWRVSSLMVMW